MIEIFLFVNPIGVACFKNEAELQKAIKLTDKNVRYHYVPISTMETICNDIMRRGENSFNLDIHNEVANATYNALRDYHALSCLGNKKARHFILRLQEELNTHKKRYSRGLVNQILDQMGINKNIFYENRESKYTKDAISADFDLATELGVKTTPTTIIFDYEQADSSGILIEGSVSEEMLLNIFEGNICSNNRQFHTQQSSLKVL